MAALKPHLAEEGETTELEEKYFECHSRSGGDLGRMEEEDPLCPTPEAVIDQSHAGLMQDVYTREILTDQLRGSIVSPGYKGSDVVLRVDHPVTGPVWNPFAEVGSTSLLSWTTKMGTPSFSLPAGAPDMGGSCPGATAGQSTVDDRIRRLAARVMLPILDLPRDERKVNLATAVCEKCVTGDTRVLVRGRGIARIDDLLDEDVEVWSGIDWRKTRPVFQGFREVVELETSWGLRLRLTPDHKVLSDGEMVRVDELEEGDVLDSTPATSSPFPESAPLPDVPVSTHFNAVAYRLPKTWSYDVGRFLGHVIGNGAVSSGPYPTINIGGSAEDKPDLDALLDIVKRWCSTDAEVKIYHPPAGNYTKTPELAASLNMRISGIADFILALGIDKHSVPEDRRLPKTIWTASHEGVRGLLAGLFATDGSVSAGVRKVEVSFAQVSRGLIEEMQQLLFAFGIRSNICEYKSNRERGFLPLYKLSIGSYVHVKRFAETIGFASERKQKRLLDTLGKLDPMKHQRKQPHVRSVSILPTQEAVYDLVNVGPERRFSANGITVSNCYATGGQYATGSVQFHQMVRFAWARRAILIDSKGRRTENPRESSFVSVMIDAIERADFKLEGEPSQWKGKKFFRIHDSGDFFHPRYLMAWKAVCDHFLRPRGNQLPITFWAPTRIWAMGDTWIDLVSEINKGDTNLVLRPSGYHVNQHGPNLQNHHGWAAATTVFHHDDVEGAQGQDFDWNCKAYAVEKGPSCRGAVGSDARGNPTKVGCRTCWIHPHLRVNYTLH